MSNVEFDQGGQGEQGGQAHSKAISRMVPALGACDDGSRLVHLFVWLWLHRRLSALRAGCAALGSVATLPGGARPDRCWSVSLPTGLARSGCR